MARNPAQAMSGYGVAAMAPVSILAPAAATASLNLPSIASYARPPHDVRNARAYAHWLASGGRKRLAHRNSLSGVLGFLGDALGRTMGTSRRKRRIRRNRRHHRAIYGQPGGFIVAQVGSANRPTAGFHDYGYADAFGNAWGVLDPAQLLEANDAAGQTRQSESLADTLKALSPAITTVVDSINDPYKRVQILEAKIKKAKRSGASASKLQRLYAKLDAAKHRLSIKDEALDSTRDWRMLGKAGIVTGIGVGAAIIFFIMMQSFKGRRVAVAA